jgi:hypothetical protein
MDVDCLGFEKPTMEVLAKKGGFSFPIFYAIGNPQILWVLV